MLDPDYYIVPDGTFTVVTCGLRQSVICFSDPAMFMHIVDSRMILLELVVCDPDATQ